MLTINQLRRFGPRTTNRYLALTDAEQDVVDAALDRHRKACERNRIAPDYNFLIEIIGEVEEGRIRVVKSGV